MVAIERIEKSIKNRRRFMSALPRVASPMERNSMLLDGSFSHRTAGSAGNPLLESAAMAQFRPLRLILLAVLGLALGFLALAIAIPTEPQLLPWVIALFSPGLKLAELVTPTETGRSIAWTFSWFFRIAIAANTAFYFAILALLAWLLGRRRNPSEER
jgi:hypothetical protein